MRRTSSGDRVVRVTERAAGAPSAGVAVRAAGVRRTSPAAVRDGAAGAGAGAGAGATSGLAVGVGADGAGATSGLAGADGAAGVPLRRGSIPGSTIGASCGSRSTGSTGADSTAPAAPAATPTGRLFGRRALLVRPPAAAITS